MGRRLDCLMCGVKGLVAVACCFIALSGILLRAPLPRMLVALRREAFASPQRLVDYDESDLEPEALPDQQPQPNSWHGTRTPYFFYCYSAYLDVRTHQRDGEPAINIRRVVVHSVAHESRLVDLRWCVLHYKNGTKTPKMRANTMGYGSGFHDGKATASTFCPLTSMDTPVSISLFTAPNKFMMCSNMPVRRAEKPAQMKPLGLCVSPIYRASDCSKCKPNNISAELLPWIEMQRLLGVNGMTIYYQSHYGQSSTILNYYSKIGFAEVVYQSDIPGYKKYVPNGNAIQDCVYRNMYKYEKLLVIDLDEYIIPRNEKGFVELIKDVAKSSHVEYNGTQFWFANSYYYRDYWLVEDAYEPRFPILRYRYHVAPQDFPGSCKSIMDPRVCSVATPHMCVVTIYGKKHGSVIKMDPALARLHHYKDCKTNWWKPANDKCAMKSLQRDDIVLSYKARLLERVEKVEKDMHTITN